SALHMTTVGIGAVLAVGVATEFFLLYPSGTWADRFGRKAVAIPSLAYFSVVLAAAGFSGRPLVYGVMLGLMGIGSGSLAVAPSSMLSDVTAGRRTGQPVGVFRFFGDLGFVFGPLAAGWSAGAFGFKVAFALMAVPLLFAMALLLRIPETLSRDGGAGSGADALAAGVPHHQHD